MRVAGEEGVPFIAVSELDSVQVFVGVGGARVRVAGEAGVPFISVSGSEFVKVFVGVGAARVRVAGDAFMDTDSDGEKVLNVIVMEVENNDSSSRKRVADFF